MSRITLEIGQVIVLAEAERVKLERLEPTIREAFRLLSERLDQTPFRQFGQAHNYTLDRLELSTLPLDEMLSPRGAERLADELYRQLVRRQL